MKQPFNHPGVLPLEHAPPFLVVLANMVEIVVPGGDGCCAEPTAPGAPDRRVLDGLGRAVGIIEAMLMAQVLGQKGCPRERSWASSAQVSLSSVMGLEFMEFPFSLCVERCVTEGAAITRALGNAALPTVVVHRASF
jgi:hypothetical protein